MDNILYIYTLTMLAVRHNPWWALHVHLVYAVNLILNNISFTLSHVISRLHSPQSLCVNFTNLD